MPWGYCSPWCKAVPAFARIVACVAAYVTSCAAAAPLSFHPILLPTFLGPLSSHHHNHPFNKAHQLTSWLIPAPSMGFLWAFCTPPCQNTLCDRCVVFVNFCYFLLQNLNLYWKLPSLSHFFTTEIAILTPYAAGNSFNYSCSKRDLYKH